MSIRVTIMIEAVLDKKIRVLQAKRIQKTASSVSYSRVINELLKKQVK